jgi:hypothetical protein
LFRVNEYNLDDNMYDFLGNPLAQLESNFKVASLQEEKESRRTDCQRNTKPAGCEKVRMLMLQEKKGPSASIPDPVDPINPTLTAPTPTPTPTPAPVSPLSELSINKGNEVSPPATAVPHPI